MIRFALHLPVYNETPERIVGILHYKDCRFGKSAAPIRGPAAAQFSASPPDAKTFSSPRPSR
jgi:hypothetical protein